jgi:hypothetical protein
MRKYVWAALCSSLVAACGGGGGDAAPPVGTVPISDANQVQVARTSASAVISLAGAGGSATASSGGAGVASLPGVSRHIALALAGTRKAALGVQPQAIQPVIPTQACPAGGTFGVTYDDTNVNQRLDIGEVLTFTFSNCKSTVDDNVNGTISVTVSSASATGYSGTMTLNLASSVGARSATVAGSVTVNFTELSASQSRTELTVGANALTGTVTVPGVGSETITYETGFSIATTDTVNGSTPVSTSSIVSGAISASGLANGRIVLATPTPIVQLAADLYPSSGAMRVTGASGSTLLITAVSASQVRLQLDTDGNGSYERDQTLPWGTVLPSTAN